MLHWVRAFLTIALIAAPFALIAPLRWPALILVTVFAALALLALITGLFGRTSIGPPLSIWNYRDCMAAPYLRGIKHARIECSGSGAGADSPP